MSDFNLKLIRPATLRTLGALALAALSAAPAFAHAGRNFAVQVVDDGAADQQLQLQGFNTLGPEAGVDPNGRQFFGAVHDHFSFIDGGAEAEQPGFLVNASENELLGHSLTLQVIGAKKWVVDRSNVLMDGSAMLAPGIGIDDITYQPLADSETIFINAVRNPGDFVDTTGLGELLLTAPGGVTDGGLAGSDDIEVTYDIGVQAPDTIFVIESVLKTSAPGVADSDPFFTILSPDGEGMRDRLHFPSLLVEQSLGTPVPEPTSLAIAALLPLLVRRRRRA